MITFALDLNLIPSGVMPRISVSQYDHGQMVECDIYDGMQVFTIPNSSTAYVQGTKGDNTGFQYNATIANNKIKFEITEQMSAVAGDVVAELVIAKSGDRIGTINFIICVEEAALSDDTIISETDLPVIQQIPEYVEEAQDYAEEAEAWATGGTEGTPSAVNNAKYWAEQAQLYAVGALHWKGNVAFANLPTSNLTVGDVYNVTDAFTTDNRFNEGTGIPCPANTNVIWGSNSKWDLQAPNAVHSFNGRVGAVVPASGDYTAAQISHGNSNVGTDIEALQDRWKTITNGNMNNITTNGVYTCVNCSNCPLDEDDEPMATNWSMLVMATDANNVYQFVTSFDTGFHAVFSRKKVQGTWKSWTNSNINLVWDSISAIYTDINTINANLIDKADTYSISTGGTALATYLNANWSSLPTSRKCIVSMTDGADVYTGLLCKYSNSVGSIVFQNSSGTLYKYSKSTGTIQTLIDETLASFGAKKIFNFVLDAGVFTTISYNDNWHKNKYYAIFHCLNSGTCHFYLRQCTTEHQMNCEAMTGDPFTQYTNIAIELT